ncbi:twin-arginine translocase TatA/TatE family subunit [Glaciihabitans sp. GrIS 2.15]|uniref:twin-arginine translocase TatA/TatE family subunit n=1 Tax=Glaciihabitans sp. GrIS 2.15 TaxID=3071710 RepID=UPI0019B8D283|nr:twin-arginine translocase TatA/TatE family subunit [Microbacteriaceae bacterium]MEC5168602.1 sec-independent protein translocase protein TatB [Glaciihabitans sp. GrIS 2.15]
MFGGLTIDKFLVILVIAVFLLGPERIPHYAAQLGRLVRSIRDMADGAKERLREEMGPDFDDVDWKKLDPRQYDPRRIIREALLEDPNDRVDVPLTIVQPSGESAYAKRKRLMAESGGALPAIAPFDTEAT